MRLLGSLYFIRQIDKNVKAFLPSHALAAGLRPPQNISSSHPPLHLSLLSHFRDISVFQFFIIFLRMQ